MPLKSLIVSSWANPPTKRATFVPGTRMAPGLFGSARYLLTSKNVGVGDAAELSGSVSARAAIGTRISASAASVVAGPDLLRPRGMFERSGDEPRNYRFGAH